MRKLLFTLLGLVVLNSFSAYGATPCEGCPELPTRFEYFPAGATVSPALLITDVVAGEAYDEAGLSKCDFLLGFESADKSIVDDLWKHPNANSFRRGLDTASRGGGAYLRVFKRNDVMQPDGVANGIYELVLPHPKVTLNPTPGDRLIAAQAFHLVVTDVAPNTEAEALGLQVGDIVYDVNGDNSFRALVSAVGAHAAMNKAVGKNTDTVTLQVVRCEPWEDGYILRRQDVITFSVNMQ